MEFSLTCDVLTTSRLNSVNCPSATLAVLAGRLGITFVNPPNPQGKDAEVAVFALFPFYGSFHCYEFPGPDEVSSNHRHFVLSSFHYYDSMKIKQIARCEKRKSKDFHLQPCSRRLPRPLHPKASLQLPPGFLPSHLVSLIHSSVLRSFPTFISLSL
jgi:hypothetical protein